jgi:hypothetical protein
MMPIESDEEGDSYRAYLRGMNNVWRDTARHRHEFSGHNGPKQKAAPYMLPIEQLQLFGRVDVKALPEANPFALAAKSQTNALENLEPEALFELQKATGEYMVLPRPIVEVCTASIGRRSALLEPWMAYRLEEIPYLNPTQKCERAAEAIGALLGEYFAGRLDLEARKHWQFSWGVIGSFISIPFFVELLALELCGERFTKLSEFREAGNPQLHAAMELKRAQEQYDRICNRIRERGLPVGKDQPETPLLLLGAIDYSDAPEFVDGKFIKRRYRVVVTPTGEPFRVENRNPLNNRGSHTWATFVVDNTDAQLKVMEVPLRLVEQFKAKPRRKWELTRPRHAGLVSPVTAKDKGPARIDLNSPVLAAAMDKEDVQAYFNGKLYARRALLAAETHLRALQENYEEHYVRCYEKQRAEVEASRKTAGAKKK